MATVMNAPAEFAGTEDERAANRATHRFFGDRCDACDCRPFGRYADWPCGADVPRVVEPATDYLAANHAAYALAAEVLEGAF